MSKDRMPAIARAEMLIRSPVSTVFDAFVQPALLRKFWLKGASAPSGRARRSTGSFEFPVPPKQSRSRVSSMRRRSPSFGQVAGPFKYISMRRASPAPCRRLIQSLGPHASALSQSNRGDSSYPHTALEETRTCQAIEFSRRLSQPCIRCM